MKKLSEAYAEKDHTVFIVCCQCKTAFINDVYKCGALICPNCMVRGGLTNLGLYRLGSNGELCTFCKRHYEDDPCILWASDTEFCIDNFEWK